MTHKHFVIAVLALSVLAAAGAGMAQRFRGRNTQSYDPRFGVPTWEVDERFKDEVFTFVRVHYSSSRGNWDYDDGPVQGRLGRPYHGYGDGGAGWETDCPQAEMNFSFRLHQLTSIKVNPQPIVLKLTDDELFNYPFLYMLEAGTGRLQFTEQEVVALRRYLLNGGFLMVDDFWGDWDWEIFSQQIKRVFPTRDIVDVPIEHEIFHCVYNIKEKPQVLNIRAAQQGRPWGITYEDHGPGCEQVHYRAILDDKKRIMVFICHNTDLGDGWEREGNDEWFFHNFCENKSYPMGINIVTYAMTH